jgi:hypothetical protein
LLNVSCGHGSIRSALGLESEKKVFERYREIRRAEREYV